MPCIPCMPCMPTPGMPMPCMPMCMPIWLPTIPPGKPIPPTIMLGIPMFCMPIGIIMGFMGGMPGTTPTPASPPGKAAGPVAAAAASSSALTASGLPDASGAGPSGGGGASSAGAGTSWVATKDPALCAPPSKIDLPVVGLRISNFFRAAVDGVGGASPAGEGGAICGAGDGPALAGVAGGLNCAGADAASCVTGPIADSSVSTVGDTGAGIAGCSPGNGPGGRWPGITWNPCICMGMTPKPCICICCCIIIWCIICCWCWCCSSCCWCSCCWCSRDPGWSPPSAARSPSPSVPVGGRPVGEPTCRAVMSPMGLDTTNWPGMPGWANPIWVSCMPGCGPAEAWGPIVGVKLPGSPW
mmetsp:Transcript_49097/g.111387  ORF Transcript_49097/g.111387 Transcript_49097/m.111387 type:complete len:356 (+) Transcript_49097:3-1070(+)